MTALDVLRRPLRNLRVSVTDRCNLRCAYCMPPEGLEWLPNDDVLSDDEVVRVVRVAVDLGVTEVCFEVGCSSLGTFSTRFTELVGVPPSTYRQEAARATAGMPSCIAKQVTRPIRNREASAAESTVE